jgi:ethanolamine utilization protein EutA (predicted chaperonin)
MHDEDEFPGAHSHDELGNAIPEDIEGLEMFTLRSVGIDIGSSTSHLVFSHLTLRREGANLSAQFKVTDRKVLFRSPIMLTPYTSGTLIDTDKVINFVHAAYKEAGFKPEDIDTGAVVITGEALNKENAQPIVEFFAKDSGKFICASAGPNHEALLAAYGCGAVALSRDEHCSVLNIDMGGGTTKLSIIRDGIVAETAAVSVGARLVAVGPMGSATRVEPPAHLYMPAAGHGDVNVGDKVTEQALRDFAGKQADVLFELIEAKPLSDLTKQLMVTEPFTTFKGVNDFRYIIFSGGVSEFVYQHETSSFGDMGSYLAEHVRERLKRLPKPDMLREPAEGIRATVIGAGEYTIQASGVTSYISSTKDLPAFGLKVVRLQNEDGDSLADAARRALGKFDLDRFGAGVVLALSVHGQPNYQSLRRVAEGITEIINADDSSEDPLILILDLDVAKSLGGILKEELGVSREIVALDGIDVGDLDYVDVGRPMGVSESVPVTVKSLMFPAHKD